MPAKLTTEEFIDRARAVHGDKYGYAFSVYRSANIKVLIHCPEHGMFHQKPYIHMKSNGCPWCGHELRLLTKRPDKEEFISKAKEVHGDRYDYSKISYTNNKCKINIVCPHHGIFSQSPNSHLSGSGCPGCSDHGFDRTKVGFLYVLRSECGQYMKIGITHKPDKRYSQLSKSTPFSFKRIELIEGPGDSIADLEKELLAKYQQAEFTETFDGYSEWRLWDDSVRNKLKVSV